MDLSEDEKCAGKGHREPHSQRHQVEQQRRQAAEHPDKQKDGAGNFEERQQVISSIATRAP